MWAVGPILIRQRNELLSRAQARAALGLPGRINEDTLLIYCSFGGGGEPESRRALELTSRAVSALPNAHLVIGQGPLLLTDPEPRDGMTVVRGRYPMMDVLPAFDGGGGRCGLQHGA